jgi:hypothetical protein
MVDLDIACIERPSLWENIEIILIIPLAVLAGHAAQ